MFRFLAVNLVVLHALHVQLLVATQAGPPPLSSVRWKYRQLACASELVCRRWVVASRTLERAGSSGRAAARCYICRAGRCARSRVTKLPLVLVAAATKVPAKIIFLARPTGIEPVFPP